MSGASYLHDLGVVHGDLKGVRLADFSPDFYPTDRLKGEYSRR